ncbi:MAG: TIGR00341 family protein [Gammaproteobacteria bacterium]
MKLIQVIADQGNLDTLLSIAEQYQVIDSWYQLEEAQRCCVHMLVENKQRQKVMDALQKILSKSEGQRIVVLPVEAVSPRPKNSDGDSDKSNHEMTTREELYNKIERGGRFNPHFVIMVLLSTIVASIGLIQNNVAVLVGAMVIAPLLGPNLALSFSTTLGDGPLIWSSIRTLLSGITIAFVVSFLIGLMFPVEVPNSEILSRTHVGYDHVILALASGAAAVLSLTMGEASVLVGVMVAVALLPPTATVGMMLASSHLSLASSAAMLLAVNIVSVNLAANLVFYLKGVRPRTWLENKKASQSRLLSGLIWSCALMILLFVMLKK